MGVQKRTRYTRGFRHNLIFFFNDTATTEIYTLSLHDALPIYAARIISETHVTREAPRQAHTESLHVPDAASGTGDTRQRDRKSTRLNSSHANISYAVFCLKKKTSLSPPLSLLLYRHLTLITFY